MRKYTLILLSILLLAFQVRGQVGIQTINPQNGGAIGVLHIDGSGNNNTTGTPAAAQISDDVLINSFGRMGIGNINPTHMLHITTGGTFTSPISGIKIEDGSQGATKLLVSDANGNAKWDYVGEILAVKGVLSPGGISPAISDYTSGGFGYTGSYIDLPPGRWMVMVSMILSVSGGTSDITERAWIRSTFCDSSSPTNSSADLVPLLLRWVSGLGYSTSPNLINGFLIIYNSTTASKRYYYSIGSTVIMGTMPSTCKLVNFGAGSYRQNYILALKMKNN